MIDFTLAELKTLRAIQPFRGRLEGVGQLYAIPTFDEVLDLALSSHTVSARPGVHVYPEAKSPRLPRRRRPGSTWARRSSPR